MTIKGTAPSRRSDARAARPVGWLHQPVAVTMLAILHVIGDDEDPYGLVAQIRDAMPSGSYLAVSHLPSDLEPKLAESRDWVNRLSHQQYTHRRHAEVLRFFDGLQMVEPGLVELGKWRPAVESARVTPGWCGRPRTA